MARSRLKDRLNQRQNAIGSTPKDKMLSRTSALQQPHPHSIPQFDDTQSQKEQRERVRREKEDAYEKRLEVSHLKRAHEKSVRERSRKGIKKASTILLCLLSVYFLFLIFGVIHTEYVYNENNEVVPKRTSYSEIQSLSEFKRLTTQYYACRSVYERILLLDCRYMTVESHEDAVLIGTEYWEALDSIQTIGVQINGLVVPSEYENIKNQMYTWATTYIAVYCQNMSYSILNNSDSDLTKALEYQQYTYNGFSIITSNLASVGTKISGAEEDVKNISEWTPSAFVSEQTGGLFQ